MGKVVNMNMTPEIDDENPELAKDPKVKFHKPNSKKS